MINRLSNCISCAALVTFLSSTLAFAGPQTQPATRPAGSLGAVCPQAVLGEARHGQDLVMYYQGRHLVALTPAGQKPDQPVDGFASIVRAGVDLVPAPGASGDLEIRPIADGTVVDVIEDDKDAGYKYYGYAVLIRHKEKFGGRDTYSLYAHLRSPPGMRMAENMDMKMMAKKPVGEPAEEETEPAKKADEKKPADNPAGVKEPGEKAPADKNSAAEEKPATQPSPQSLPATEEGSPKRMIVGDEVKAGQTFLGFMGETGAAFGKKVHVEVRHFSGRYHPIWRGPFGVHGRTFSPRDLRIDWIDPLRYDALSRPDLPAMTQTLRDADEAAKRVALQDLTAIGPAATPARAELEKLAAAGQQPDIASRAAEAYVATFGRGGDSVDNLLPLLKHALESIRAEATQVLGFGGRDARPAVIPALIGVLSDENPSVRASAAVAIARYAPDATEAIPALRKALKEEKSSEPLFEAGAAVANFGPVAKDAIPEILAALPKLPPASRAGLIERLARFGGEARVALPVLEKLSEDADPQVRQAARIAYQKIEFLDAAGQ